MLKVEHITTGYGKKQVLTDITFHVAQGETLLLTGGNGSGKSTVLKTIYGLLKPWTAEGKIYFEEKNITTLPTSQMIHIGIVYVPQKNNVFEDFTVEENLLTSAGIYSRKEAKHRRDNVFIMLPRLKELRKRTPFHLSGGEKQLLAFGNALVHSPKLILFDEPFAGVDPEYVFYLNSAMQTMRDKKSTFLIVEHRRQLLQSVESTVIELELGKIKK
ncbi:MAG: ATP-binding cassette domain-containing protein [Bacteroidales bacterium]|jgi:branched-chain amino acid transport system ATP-binding protein|nr:ATP-binding cassette domain-containing protein [Bacteroidales bacterium]MDX9795630.1 ATP-binding cassette domain-containing protein [Arcobacteraceae bacterium]